MKQTSQPPSPIYELPEGYQQAYHMNLLEGDVLRRLNWMSLIVALPFFIGGRLWLALVQSVSGSYDAPLPLPGVVLVIVGVLGVIILHELIHGAAIRWAGHKPRYGFLQMDGIPVAFYATADDAYFPRNAFIVIALAPAVVITLVGAVLMIFLPDRLNYYLLLAVVVNGAGAVGDFYMTHIVLKFEEGRTLVQDNMEAITVFVRVAG